MESKAPIIAKYSWVGSGNYYVMHLPLKNMCTCVRLEGGSSEREYYKVKHDTLYMQQLISILRLKY